MRKIALRFGSYTLSILLSFIVAIIIVVSSPDYEMAYAMGYYEDSILIPYFKAQNKPNPPSYKSNDEDTLLVDNTPEMANTEVTDSTEALEQESEIKEEISTENTTIKETIETPTTEEADIEKPTHDYAEAESTEKPDNSQKENASEPVKEEYYPPEKGYALTHAQGEKLALDSMTIYASEIQTMQESINAYRIANGLQPCIYDYKLTIAANHRANENAFCNWMKSGNVEGMGFQHIRPTGQIAWTIFDEYGYAKRDFGEVLARFFTSPDKALVEWKKSPTHNDILLGNYTYMGVGIAKDDNGKLYYTVLFMN